MSTEALKLEPIETVRYWADAYSDPASGDHFMGHGKAASLLAEYLKLREALTDPVAAEPVREPLSKDQEARLIGAYFAESWAQAAAEGLMHDYRQALAEAWGVKLSGITKETT